MNLNLVLKQLISKVIPNGVKLKTRRLYWKFYYNVIRGFTIKNYNELEVSKHVIAYNKYGVYCIPKETAYRPAAQKIINGEVYEPETINFIASNWTSGDIIHAGAYFGDFLPALSQSCKSNFEVWAFEPNLENFRCAQITKEINNLQNVKLKNVGLGEKKESLSMKIANEKGQFLGGNSQIIEGNTSFKFKTEKIQIVSLDEIIGKNKNISIIQLDVEGFEKKALKGALQTILTHKPILILERWPESRLFESKWFSENILNLGYKKIHKIHENIVFKFK